MFFPFANANCKRFCGLPPERPGHLWRERVGNHQGLNSALSLPVVAFPTSSGLSEPLKQLGYLRSCNAWRIPGTREPGGLPSMSFLSEQTMSFISFKNTTWKLYLTLNIHLKLVRTKTYCYIRQAWKHSVITQKEEFDIGTTISGFLCRQGS